MICGRASSGFEKCSSSHCCRSWRSACARGEAQSSGAQAAAPRAAGRPAAIPMRDGVVLRADVLLPSGTGPFPVLVYRTPYGEKNAQREYTTFQHAVERGLRRRGAGCARPLSARTAYFVPYQNEGRDGYDTIEWAAKQPWSNGKVGTFGLSYPGAVQWLAAVESPPHLAAMVPAMVFSSHRNFFYAGGAFDLSWIEWIWDDIAPDMRVKQNAPGPRTDDEAEAAWKKSGLDMESVLPLSALEPLRGIAPYYYEWLRHPPDDPWWNWADLRGKYGRTQAAVLNLSGWYDEHYGPEGATTNFQGLIETRGGPPEQRRAVDRTLDSWRQVDGNRQSRRSHVPGHGEDRLRRTVLDWMDHYLRGIDNGVDQTASGPLLRDGGGFLAGKRRHGRRLIARELLSWRRIARTAGIAQRSSAEPGRLQHLRFRSRASGDG